MVPSSIELRKNSGCDIATNKSRPQTDLHMKSRGDGDVQVEARFFERNKKKLIRQRLTCDQVLGRLFLVIDDSSIAGLWRIG